MMCLAKTLVWMLLWMMLRDDSIVMSAYIAVPAIFPYHRPGDYYYQTTSYCSTTELFGVRQALRRRLSRAFRKIDNTVPPRPPDLQNNSIFVETQLDESSVVSKDISSTRELVTAQVSLVPQETEATMTELLKSTSNTLVTAPTAPAFTIPTGLLLPKDGSIYTLPPLDRELNDLEQEFRNMLSAFTQYSARDVLSIRSDRLRLLFEGIVASADDPAVYRAFEVLFEDLYPVRVAGRLIFRQLQKVLRQSRQEQTEEVAAVVASTGLDRQSVEQARLVFLAIALRLNHDTYLTLPQLLTTGLANTAVETLRFDSAQAFLERIDTSKTGRLRFADMMLGLHQCAEEICVVQDCNVAETVRLVVSELVEHPPTIALPRPSDDGKRERLAKRYDHMVECFQEWENLVPMDEQPAGRRQARLLDVVRGCFVGSKNVQVVNALRVLYTDYTGLRLAGDLIFKVVSTLIEGRRKRNTEQNETQ
jgi:hypothetical protein